MILPQIPINILLADDDIDDCMFFKIALNGLNQSTVLKTVNNGEQLMQLLGEENNELPNVLFLDLNMPRKNGFECLSEIKMNKRLENLPVIIFSTSLENEIVNLLYENGAQYFIRKPSEFSKYKQIIGETVKLISEKKTEQPRREDFVLEVKYVHS